MFLSNEWMKWVWDNFSIAIVAFPTVVTFGLKLVAIFHPSIPSDKIIDVFKQFWPKGK